MCDMHQGGGSCQQPHDDHEEPMPAVGGCAIETRDDAYTLGLTKQGAQTEVSFVDALPAPPSRGDNVWTLRVTDLDGVPLSDLEVTVDPFMPDHFHGTSIRCEVTPGEVPGEYVLEPLNLFMPGLWEITVSLERDDLDDDVLFSFCVDP